MIKSFFLLHLEKQILCFVIDAFRQNWEGHSSGGDPPESDE